MSTKGVLSIFSRLIKSDVHLLQTETYPRTLITLHKSRNVTYLIFSITSYGNIHCNDDEYRLKITN